MLPQGTALKGAADQAAVVRGSGGPQLDSAADYGSELLARAMAIKVASSDPNADEEEALKLGFSGIKEAVKGLDEWAKSDKPLEVLVLQEAPATFALTESVNAAA